MCEFLYIECLLCCVYVVVVVEVCFCFDSGIV